MWRQIAPAVAAKIWLCLLGGTLSAGAFCAGCGGGTSSQIQPPPPSSDFALSLSPSSVTIDQGTTSSIQVSVQSLNGFSGSVQVALSGLPAGIVANPQSAFPVQSGSSATLLLGASLLAATGSFSISAQATSGTLSHSAILSLTVQSGAAAGVSRTTFIRTDSMASLDDPVGEPHHRHIAYDPANYHLFIANRAGNRVEVLSTQDGSRVAAVDVAGATSADLSADGKTIWVGTVTEQIAGIDTGTLQRTTIAPIAGLQPIPNTLFDRPEEVVALASGRALVRLRQASSDESLLAIWDPAANSLTDLTSSAPQIFQNGAGVMARSGDQTRVLVASNDASGEAAVFDNNGDVAAAPIALGSGAILYAAANNDGSRLAVVLSSGGSQQLLLLNSTLNVLASRATTSARGIAFSADGASLYIAESQSGTPVVTALAAAGLSLLGEVQDPSIQGVGTEVEASDETALLFGLSNRGVSLVDASQPGTVASPAPATANTPAASPTGGPNIGGTAVLLSGRDFAANPVVHFGQQAAASVGGATATQIQATSPASALNGAVNVAAYFQGGAIALAPDAFSYGPELREVLPSAGRPVGGDTIAVYGYGFGEDPSKVTVQFGSATATVQKLEDVSSLSASLELDASYPFPLQSLTVTSPPGSPGVVDISVSAPSGSTTGKQCFQYLQSAQVFAKAGLYKFLTYDQKRQWIYLSNIDHVDVFDLTAGSFRAGILPPGGPPPDGLIREAALTPDASQLLTADFGAQSIYLIDPDTGAGATVKVGGVPGYANSGPAQIATTSAGTAFVGLAEYGASSSGCSTCLQQLDLSVSPVTIGPPPEPQLSVLTSSPLLGSSGDGTMAFFVFAAAPGAPMAAWNSAAPQAFAAAQTNVAATDLAVAADGTFFAVRAGDSVELRDQSLNLRAVTNAAELEGIPARTEAPGIALHPSGALLYVPFLIGAPPASPPWTGLQGGIDILDANTGRLRMRIMLPEPFAMLADDVDGLHGRFLAVDENGQRLFALTASGLTVVQLDDVPLGFGTISPSSGPASGATTATIRGSGFQSGATVTLGGKSATVSFVDMNTLKITLPALSSGPQRITITNPSGETISVDTAFNVN